ncbi:hypothetical protein D621_14785 [beta proteobacterium AAP51]|nr:hypothetical protein D621_14785 [beta proteobacterium AAP51]
MAGSAAEPAGGDTTALEFSFDLAQARSTSAGIYAADGRLLRTLWRGERLPPGRHVRRWDLQMDDGSPAPAAEVTVRVMHHDVQYRWQGVVGNTSARAGQMPFRSFMPPASLAADGRQLHIGLGYNEGQSAVTGLNTEDPQRPAPAVQHRDPFIGIGLVASDGTALYMAQTGGLSKQGFVFARRLADAQPVAFTQGQALCLNVWAGTTRCYPDQHYPSVLGWRPEGEPLPTGLAVQRGGVLLALAYASEQRVRVFHKHSGVLLAQWAAPLSRDGQNQLAMGADGDLWLLGEGRVLRYTDIAGTARIAGSIEGLEQPLALATDPQNADAIWVAEGGAAQQLRRFGRGGVVERVLGQRGGLAGDGRVSDDRLCFAGPGGREHTALALDGAGLLWVADTCNNRLQRLATDGRAAALAASVAWLPASYVTAVDSARPRRVFAHFMEFEVDAALTAEGQLGWRLVRNWLPGLPPALRDERAANLHWGGFQAVHTLANGRSYAQMNVQGTPWLVELAPEGRVLARLRLAPEAGDTRARSPEVMQPGGDLHHAVDEGAHQLVMRRRLEGYAADGTPRWAAQATVLARLPKTANTPHHRMGSFAGLMGPRWPVTASGLVLSFNASVEDREGFHLGAVPVDGAAWSWQASPSGAMDGRGSFQQRASDARIEYGGNVVMTAGRAVVYGYHGEFYTDLSNGRVGQANQFMHFLDNGLFVGQFGRPSTVDAPDAAPAPGRSGNAFSPWLVQSEGRTLLYHNDESSWGGVHRWELQGLDGITELRASGTRGSRLTLR